MTGGMIWGLGQALLESSGVDPNLGRFISKNLAGYLVPVNADVPELDASFIEDEVEEIASTLGAKVAIRSQVARLAIMCCNSTP